MKNEKDLYNASEEMGMGSKIVVLPVDDDGYEETLQNDIEKAFENWFDRWNPKSYKVVGTQVFDGIEQKYLSITYEIIK